MGCEQIDQDSVLGFIANHVEFAHRGAQLVHLFLSRLGIVGTATKPLRVHPQILLELWAIAQLGLWEELGLRDAVAADLPSSATAMKDLSTRLIRAPAEYARGQSGTDLLIRVIAAWERFVDPSSARRLNAEVAIIGTMADGAMEAFADFLWKHRASTQG